jgi:hypothetical protein
VARFTEEDDILLDELGVEVETEKEASRTPREERIIAGFEEIQHFVEQHGRVPQHGEDRDIFECGCMPCASTAFASWTIAAPCLGPSIIRGFWRARSLSRFALHRR